MRKLVWFVFAFTLTTLVFLGSSPPAQADLQPDGSYSWDTGATSTTSCDDAYASGGAEGVITLFNTQVGVTPIDHTDAENYNYFCVIVGYRVSIDPWDPKYAASFSRGTCSGQPNQVLVRGFGSTEIWYECDRIY